MASCSGSCSASCDKQCDIELPTVNCDTECKASCQGACKVETNLDCQVDCQAAAYAKCEADVKGSCVAHCKTKEGALFCDGNFIDNDGAAEECLESLRAALNVKVMTSSSGSSGCTGDSCSAEGEASVSSKCSVAGVGMERDRRGMNHWPLFALTLWGIAWRVRRRR
jgi:hypothetical protein